MKIFKFHVGLMLALAILLSSIVPQNVQAATTADYKMEVTSAERTVDSAFDKFHYALAVEWDQQDQAFRKRAEKNLVKELLALEASGTSMEEIQKTMEKLLMNSKTRADYERFVSALKAQNLSDEEISAKTAAFMDQVYKEGANFNGEGGGHRVGRWSVVVVVVLVVIVTHLIIKSSRHGHDDDHDHCHSNHCDHDYDYAM